MAKSIMIQGTMSNVGKSLLTAGLCRILHQEGYSVAPFKSQNMALNSYITADGFEMGRAQVMQAEAAGIEPTVAMNPILLKPTNDTGSQVIINGTVYKTMKARDYFAFKKQLVPVVKEAYKELSDNYDVVVIEGAGSPAEINLKNEDIVNMGMAEMADSPVLLVGDIDRGGVFAQLIGTVMLLEDHERARIKGLIVNKFRGDISILEPGIKMLEEKCGIPVVGVIPYLYVDVEDEDSLSTRIESGTEVNLIDIAVVRIPRISNFTDFNPLSCIDGVSLRYVKTVDELKNPDMIIIPGTKNTMGDLSWLRQSGLEAAILKAHAKGKIIFGVCGGYQMLGESLLDPDGVEEGGEMKGLSLVPMETVFEQTKVTTRVTGKFNENISGDLSALSGVEFSGYEIHMGVSNLKGEALSMTEIDDGNCNCNCKKSEGVHFGNVYGSYVHGIFDKEEVTKAIVKSIATKKGIDMEEINTVDFKAYKETQYDLLADGIREYIDLDKIKKIINL